MNQITISNGTTTITMPQIKKIEVGGEEVCNEITMAGGKLVKEMIGFRTVVSAEWDWVPAATMRSLVTLLRGGGYFTVGYPDPDGTYRNGKFSVSIPSIGIFKFKDGVAMWHGVQLDMTAQEVL